jgi:hypothetical protein
MNILKRAFLRRASGPAVFVGFAAALLLLPAFLKAQTYSSGQPVWPAFEGWEKNTDGSFNLVFGYMNDNWEEEPFVPIGPDNNIQPGGPDQGQPTRFQPRRNRFMFRIRVPKDFGTKELVWSLTTQGKPQKAYGSLRADLVLENVDLMSEGGALGAGASSPELRADKAPVVTIEGGKTRAAKVGQPLSLTTVITDDGIPRSRQSQGGGGGREGAGREGGGGRGRNPALMPPYRPTVAKNPGLHMSWYVYRGDGNVSFDPDQVKAWEDTRNGANSPWAPFWIAPPFPADGRQTVRVTFDQPGTYMLCARADDGALTTDEMVTVTVSK